MYEKRTYTMFSPDISLVFGKKEGLTAIVSHAEVPIPSNALLTGHLLEKRNSRIYNAQSNSFGCLA